MFNIPAPTVPFDDENRHLFCQMAVELPIQDVIEAAIAAGWSEEETLAAVSEVADNLMLANVNNAELDALLKALKRKLD
jgi:dsRNA-specific ribonuclease